MGLINTFANKTVYLDTAPLIYFIEENPAYEIVLDELFGAHRRGEFRFTTSVITLQEVLVKPITQLDTGLVAKYEYILNGSADFALLDITSATARTAAGLRARYGLKTPDALQLAAALNGGADFFLTNDHNLKRVREIPVLTVAELN